MRPFLLLLLLAGCFNPDDILPVHGTLSSVEPVGGQVIRLLRDPGAARSSSCEGNTPFKETTADAEGKFSFDVFRAQAIKLTGTGAFCFRVETTFPSGTTVFSDIVGLNGEVTLPAFTDWRAAPARVDGVLRFEPAAPLPTMESFEGDQVVHRAEWRTEDGGLAWAADDRMLEPDPMSGEVAPMRRPMLFEDLALEDFSGVVTLLARVSIQGPDEGPFGRNTTNLELRSGQTLTLSGARPALSRGLPCPPLGSPCPLTDGELTPVDAGMGQAMLLTLPAQATVSGLVFRGIETQALLMGVQLIDADGGMLPLVQKQLPTSLWNASVPSFVLRPLPDGGLDFVPMAEARFFTVTFDAGVPVTEVRAGFAGGVERISEVSLFE